MTKLTQEELELLHDLDAAPPKFSAREFDDRHRFGDPGTMQFLAVMAAVMTHDPGIEFEKLLDEIDVRVVRAGGSLEMAAAVADAEFADKH
jgi:hypothetical protein